QLVNIVVGASFGWTTILGGIDASTLQLGLSAAIFAACVPLGLAQSVLLGAGRNHTAVLLLALYPPLVLAGVLGCMILDLASTWTVVVPPAALFLTLCVTAWRAMRLVDLGWRSVLERVPFVRSTKGSRIRQMAVPKFLIAVTAASTLHADRIVLNHVGSTESVASYSLAAQIFAPALAVITAGVAPIWPMYEKARSQGAPAPRVIYVMAAFTAGAALMCVPLVLVASYAASLISDDRVGVSLGLALSWACVIVAQAAAASVAMTRMDRDGIRFISRWCIASAPVNIALSVVLAATWGAAGPLIATALTVTVMQAMPIYLFHRLRPVAQKPDKTEVAVEKMP
ncbi:MAG: polysaccharide biosynthesis protein, partial [Thermoleophilia bacterium]|nr:polysaccharide biosynthesis protein [Thermoleophilia bacterium]